MSIAYCDNCGEIITGAKFSPGQETLCSACQRSSSGHDDEPVTHELKLEPTPPPPSPLAPSATMVMSAHDLQAAVADDAKRNASRTDLAPMSDATSDDSDDHEDEDFSVGSMLDSDELDLFSTDTIARRKRQPKPRTATNLSIVEDEDDDFDPDDLPGADKPPSGLAVFDQTLKLTGELGTEARLPGRDEVPRRSSSAPVDAATQQNDAERVAAAKPKRKGSSVVRKRPGTSIVARSSRPANIPAPELDPLGAAALNALGSTDLPNDTADPTLPPTEAPRATPVAPAWSGPVENHSAFGDCDSPPTMVLAPPSSGGFASSFGSSEEPTMMEPLAKPTGDIPLVEPTPKALDKPSVAVKGDRWHLACLDCDSKLALPPVAKRSRVRCPRCSSSFRVETDGTYEAVDVGTKEEGQRVAHFGEPTGPMSTGSAAPNMMSPSGADVTSLMPPASLNPATPAAPTERINLDHLGTERFGPVESMPADVPASSFEPTGIMLPPAEEFGTNAVEQTAPETPQLHWSLDGRPARTWKCDLRDLVWLAIVATPLTLGVLLAGGKLPIDDAQDILSGIGASAQTTVEQLLARLRG